MKKVKRLARSLEVARDRELRGQRSVKLLREDIDRRKQTLEQLQRYGDEYRLALSPQMGTRISPRTLVQTGAFLAKLDVTIQQQTEQIGQLKETFQQHEQSWALQRRKRAALDRYVSRVNEEALRKRHRSEQRAMDDYPRLIEGFDPED